MKTVVLKDLTGQRFGRLVVVGQADDYTTKSGKHHTAWLCKCDCGNTCVKQGYLLKCGRVTSCGCKLSEPKRETNGVSKMPHYGAWAELRRKKNDFCEEWKSPKAFCEWYEKNQPSEMYRLTRIREDEPYSPENCKFVKVHTVTYNGEEHTYAEWAKITGIKTVTIKARLNYYGWSVKDTLTVEPKHGNRVDKNEES